MTAECKETYVTLGHLMLGEGCPTCTHSPLVHATDGCSVCIALHVAGISADVKAALDREVERLRTEPMVAPEYARGFSDAVALMRMVLG